MGHYIHLDRQKILDMVANIDPDVFMNIKLHTLDYLVNLIQRNTGLVNIGVSSSGGYLFRVEDLRHFTMARLKHNI